MHWNDNARFHSAIHYIVDAHSHIKCVQAPIDLSSVMNYYIHVHVGSSIWSIHCNTFICSALIRHTIAHISCWRCSFSLVSFRQFFSFSATSWWILLISSLTTLRENSHVWEEGRGVSFVLYLERYREWEREKKEVVLCIRTHSMSGSLSWPIAAVNSDLISCSTSLLFSITAGGREGGREGGRGYLKCLSPSPHP